MSRLEVTGLRKAYRGRRGIDGADLAVDAGEIVALLGPNGSGKTTALRCIAGLLRPQAGRIVVDGMDLRREPRRARERMAYVPQIASFPSHARVAEVLQLHARLRNVPAARRRSALAEAGLPESLLGQLTGELSVGLRQRLGLAVANLAEPGLMLLDEPTASLDPAAAVAFRESVRSWRSAGRAVLFATHVLADAERFADRVVVLVDGRVALDETAGALRERLERRALLRVTMDATGPAHLAAARQAGAVEVVQQGADLLVTSAAEQRLEILQRLAALGPVRQLRTEEPSLESVYVELILGGADARD